MLFEEAQWFAEQLASLDRFEVYPMCNVGSSTESFRTQQQPWVDQLIFRPAAVRGDTVKHLDMKVAPGVDLVGDLADPQFRDRVSRMKFKSVLCSNMLEHVVPREAICRTLTAILPSGGFLFVSVPFVYPYHPDPIDTGFRPSPETLATIFPGTRLVRGALVGKRTFLGLRRRDPLSLALTVVRCLSPFYKPEGWWRNKGYLPWFFRRMTASCVLLRKD